MFATTLAAVSPLQMIFFFEDNISFGRKVIIFGFELINKRHERANLSFHNEG